MKVIEKNGYITRKLEDKDVIEIAYEKPMVNPPSGNRKFTSHSIGIVLDGEKEYLNLTPTQSDQIMKLYEEGKTEEGTTLECYSYDTKIRAGCVGIRLPKQGTTVPSTDTKPVSTPKLSLGKKSEEIVFNEDELAVIEEVKEFIAKGESDEAIIEALQEHYDADMLGAILVAAKKKDEPVVEDKK